MLRRVEGFLISPNDGLPEAQRNEVLTKLHQQGVVPYPAKLPAWEAYQALPEELKDHVSIIHYYADLPE